MKPQPSTAVFSFAFLLTGTGTALLGATLPATLHQFHLSDGTGGILLLAGWGGSTSGALLARGRLNISAGLGCALSAIALFSLSAGGTSWLKAFYFIYGLGLGLTMTAISLLCSQRSSSAERTAELNRLNLFWAFGACVTPTLTVRALQAFSTAPVYRGLSIVFLFVTLALMTVPLGSRAETKTILQIPSEVLAWAPLRFSLFAAASVGLESAIGSWLTTYASRRSSNVGIAVSANFAFWVGLLASRALHSVQTAGAVHGRRARYVHLALVSASIALFLLCPLSSVLPFAGLLCGFGLGPLYPYVLSLTLQRYRSMVTFVLAGCGGALIPYLTGAVSTFAASLRIGMLVPASALVLLIGTLFAIESKEPLQTDR